MSNDTEKAPPLLTVNGEAELAAAPDLAVVRLGVEAQAKTAADAQRQVNATGAAIARALGDAGVEASAVQTSGLTLGPVYTRPGEKGGEPRLAGYRAQNVVRVRLTDIARVGPVLDAALGAGANRLEGVEFSLEDDGALRREALAQAVTEARGKAEAMAAALGVALGPVQNAHEGGVSVRPVQAEMARDRAMLMAMDAPTPVAPGHVVVVAHVTLQYRLG